MSRGSLDQCPLLLIKSLSFPASTKLLAIKCLVHHNRDINTRVSSFEKPVRVLGEFSMADDPFSEPVVPQAQWLQLEVETWTEVLGLI